MSVFDILFLMPFVLLVILLTAGAVLFIIRRLNETVLDRPPRVEEEPEPPPVMESIPWEVLRERAPRARPLRQPREIRRSDG
jgi:hypothetical protein